MSWYEPVSRDPVVAVKAMAIGLAADRLGITRPVAECSRCRCSLYAQDIRTIGDGIPCDDLCPAKHQLEELYP